eukprot:TRINITY_DN879_c1_g3_i1.p2 TRINITY_DN879_c1_g3~~TRINITY_DN879_c1_g3_i1.p2  ORF type:complete len:267 (+),score=128.37 TRINITY_DN879_c1_g3_i1:67-867(+)
MFKRLLKGTVKWGLIFGAVPGGYLYGQHKMQCHYLSYLAAKGRKDEVTVYQFPPSPPCAKVLAYLDYHGLKYSAVPVNYFTKEEIFFSKDYKLLPLALIKGEQVNDSAQIIKALAGRSYDAAAMATIDEQVIPALQAVFGDNKSKVLQHQPAYDQAVIMAASPFTAQAYKQKHGDRMDAALLLPSLETAFKQIGKSYYPTPSEIALYGVLSNYSDVDVVQDALHQCGRGEWFKKLAADCAKNSKRVTVRDDDDGKPKSRCPFAHKH